MAYQSRGNGQNRKSTPQRGRTGNAQQARRRAKPKRKRFRGLKIFLGVALLAALAIVGLMGYSAYDEVNRVRETGTFYPGVYIDGVPLNGATPTEAADYLYTRASEGFKDWYIEMGYGDRRWQITPDMIGLADSLMNSIKHEVNKAYMVGRESSSILENYETIQALKTTPYEGYSSGTQQVTGVIDQIIAEIAAEVYVAGQDAYWAFDPSRSNPIVIFDEVMGYGLDEVILRDKVEEMIQTMSPGYIIIEATPKPPAITAETIRQNVQLIGEYSTKISTTSTNERNMNVIRGCDAFNGKVFKPGEKISFNSITGKRTKENGFYEALEIVSGVYEWGVGGGICQVSSTLYNAVVKAGLEVVSRTNHGLKVNYLDMGMDATVSDDRIDFVFRNNTDADIYMWARVEGEGKNKKCIFRIYGRPDPDGHYYSLQVDAPVEDKVITEPKYVKDTEGTYVTYTDEEHFVEGKPGYTVRRYFVTMDKNGVEVARRELSTDTYKPITPTIYTGVTERVVF